MSIRRVQAFSAHLPFAIEEQVVGYARSVQDALPEIFQDSQVAYNERIADQVVFIAGVKKIYAICRSNHRVLEDSFSILARQNTYTIRMGRTLLNRNSSEFVQIENLLNELTAFLDNENLMRFVLNPFYSSIIEELDEQENGSRS